MPYQDEEQGFEKTVSPLLGIDTASAPTTLAPGRWRYQINGYQGKIGANTQRPGSVPVTNTPLAAPIERLTVYRNAATEKILAFAGTSGYTYASGAWTAITGALTSAKVYDTDFTYAVNRKLIADTGALKEYNDTTGAISAVVPALDDTSPAPPNALTSINGKGIKYIFPYNGYIWLSDGSDAWWYSKRFTYDYIPSTHEIRWMKENDYMNGPGVLFDNIVLLPMRRRWGIMTPTNDVEVYTGNQFLNTVNGVIAPRSIERVTYPDGSQTVFYLSDDGVYEIYDTGNLDSGSRRYSTRSKMANRIDFIGMGFSEAEKAAAVGYYDSRLSLYLLHITKGLMPGAQRYTFAYDTRNGEWYMWTEIKAKGFLRTDELYYASETGHLCKFDATLASDWTDTAKTTGTPIDWDNITDMIEVSAYGYKSYIDYVLLWSKQFPSKSGIDLTITLHASVQQVDKAVKNQYAVWDITNWDEAVNANLSYTDVVGNPPRIKVMKPTFYVQLRFRNNRDELSELYQYQMIGRRPTT